MKKQFIFLALFACAYASPLVQNNNGDSSIFETFITYGDNVEVKQNDYISNNVRGRSEETFLDGVENYMKTHDVTFKLPVIGAVTVTGRNLDKDEFDMNLNFGSELQARGKKHKLKKIFIPILVFILLKAMALVPLALGVLGIKTWNALQLSFFSFIAAFGMAVWKLCSKLPHGPPEIIYAHDDVHHGHHIDFDHHDHHVHAGARSLDAQKIAYSSYFD